jgi:hypothetical protein
MDMESSAYTNHHGGIVTHIESGVHVILLEMGEHHHHHHHHIVGTHHMRNWMIFLKKSQRF